MINNFLPALAWITFYYMRVGGVTDPYSAFMWFRAGIIFFAFAIRYPAERRAPLPQIIVAWVSTCLPTFMQWGSANESIAIISVSLAIGGSLLVGLAVLDLGRSFGISPAVRPFVSTGVYEYVSHPIYLGHAVVESGVWLSNPTALNTGLIIAGWALYVVRAKWESELYHSHLDLMKLASQPAEHGASWAQVNTDRR